MAMDVLLEDELEGDAMMRKERCDPILRNRYPLFLRTMRRVIPEPIKSSLRYINHSILPKLD